MRRPALRSLRRCVRTPLTLLTTAALAACVAPQSPPRAPSAAVSRPAHARPAPAPSSQRPLTLPTAAIDEPMQPDRPTRRVSVPLPADLPTPPGGATAAAQGIRPGPAVAGLDITPAEARAALGAFRISCPSLVRRTDGSGLTRGEDWREACTAAPGWSDGDAQRFFARYFEAAVIGAGTAFATGYYEPEIRGSLVRQPGYEVPIYRRPPDLLEVDLSLFADDLRGRKIRGQGIDGQLRPYPDRAAIVGGALAGKGLELAWAADEVEFFFFQVQGSGKLRLPDGRAVRIGYDSQNGRDYTGIGALMRDRGLLGPGQQSMQGIMAWLRANPEQGRAIMNENKSFVFFRPISGPGPIGAMGYPVTGRATVAADPAFVPLGAPVFLQLDRTEASGLWVAQDTGGAIKGANRFDTFWGGGETARRIAGGMSGRGNAWLLLPIGTVARLNGGSIGGPGL